ncbi:hypothetical protein M406DRAFT_42447 [Cryphonectria parasitica EP155]|uniref:Centromere protein H C-terminal domain-containing protein n=1 Tax=Cryphonectria parasitica (strain ATCC 38755 / EP155) TaxID=660469 RepID=A0A9P4Y1L7_CRYP1|nr:uncharacterized protein M406DRAFT_42447 [Cryphonectria parasitica EP155]KAF3764876.1 hypothetical protein M406DRAFT_42447 [Cryphonectria parasitica EP155]
MKDALHENGIDEAPPFSEEEKEILSLYDQAQRLELEVALTKARVRLADVENGSESQEVKEAREQLLEAMALYNLRNTVVNNVLITNPILKAIHNSTYASPIEEDLQPWIRTRDSTAHSVAVQSATLRQVLDRLSEVEGETLRACRKNRELAGEVLRLAKEADRDREGAIADDPAAKEQIEALEARLRASRQRWRVIKGTAAGIVAGSGVDWVADSELRDVVLDPE